jgi:hypothetical protein
MGGVTILCATISATAAAGLPSSLRVAILFKALSYDGELAARCKGGAHVLVLARTDDEDSRRAGREMQQALGGGARISGIAVVSTLVVAASAAEAKGALARERPAIVLLAPGWPGRDLQPVVDWAVENHAIVLGSERAHLYAGAALGVFVDDTKPRIGVSKRSAAAQGARFDAGLLRSAEVFE